MKVEKQTKSLSDLDDLCRVTVYEMGNTIEICYSSHRNCSANTIKISDEEYLHVRTGELRPYQKKKKDSRKQAPESLRKTFRRIQRSILTNITDVRKVRWITLTYRENMTDTKKLYEDFRRFNMRFQTYCKKHGFGKAEYISVCEPQNRGAWHIHMFYIWENTAPYIPNEELAKIWTHGFVKIKSLDSTDNIAGYLTAYLSNLEICEEAASYIEKQKVKEIRDSDSESKYYVKGGRLHLYPAQFKIFRHSKGIKEPIKTQMSLYNALKSVQGMEQTYQCSYVISDEQGFRSDIIRAEFRKVSR